MPPPPPPAPPPPPLLNVPKADTGRSKLLSEIHKGAKLKKTVTNDRSAPVIGGNKPSSAGSSGNASGAIKPSNGPSAASSSGPPAGLGGLFANGMPTKPSDNKNKKFVATQVKAGPPPTLPQLKPTSSTVAPPPKPVNSLSVKQDGNTTHFPSNINAAPQTNIPSPPPPPPPMAQIKQKAPPPEAPPATAKPSQAQKFSTIRPTPPANKPPQLRRTGSTEETSNVSPGRPLARPAAPPPPPPSRPPVQRSAPPVVTTSTTNENNEPPPPPPPPRFSSTTSEYPSRPQRPPVMNQQQRFVPNENNGAPPPLPSTNSIDESSKPISQRFKFIDISELPPPETFKNFPKIYDQRTPAN